MSNKPRRRRSERVLNPDYVPAPRPPPLWAISPHAHQSSVEFLTIYNQYFDRTDAPMQAARWREMAIREAIVP